MVQRIEVSSKAFDSRAEVLKNEINQEFDNIIDNLIISDVYTLESNVFSHFEKIKSLISNPLIEEVSLNSPLIQDDFDFALEIGFLPGVTDNVANTARQVINDALDIDTSVYSSNIYYLRGNLDLVKVEKISEFLSNNLIERFHIKSFKKFQSDKGMDYIIPKVDLNDINDSIEVEIISASDDKLIEIGKKGIYDPIKKERRGPLALDLDSMKAIQTYFRDIEKRNPTDIELEALAQTWSEHCKHTIFASKIDDLEEGLYKGYIKKATNEVRKLLGKDDFCVSVFTDNSGVITFDEDFLITDKAETHNSPSALDPFGGSITGIVGVNRDTIGVGMGALPIINGFGFCVADPRSSPKLYRGKDKSNPALSPLKIMKGVIKGVNEGGNCSGIPTVQGFINFHKNYSGKPLVFVRTVGLIPKKVNNKDSTLKKAQEEDLVVVVGGRVGKDGIHGATFSSEAMDSGSPATAVQIGDPITQKKLSDAIIKEARDLGLYNSITDNGAGGISCSVAEMAKECGGCEVYLEKIPLKYPGMSPWEIWISESQERMTLSIPQSNWKSFEKLMQSRGVEAFVIGKFTNSGRCIVKNNGKEIMNITLDFLHEGLPKKELQTLFIKEDFDEPELTNISIKKSLIDMISRLNICSSEFIYRQYDHEVGAGSVLKPISGVGEVISESSIVRPLLNSNKAIGVSQALFPRYGDIDTYNMATCAIDTSIKNLICVGVPYKKIALMDNFCWCSSDEPGRLNQLKRAVKGCYDGSVAHLAPYISGKDSMFNDFKGFDENNNPIKISAPPTLLISSIGVMDNYLKSISPEVKFEGDLIYVIGDTKKELGGSEFYSYLGEKEHDKGYVGNTAPSVDFQTSKLIYEKMTNAINNDLITSAMPVNLGGIGIALIKKSIGGNLGVNIDLDNVVTNESLNDIEKLYSESQSRIIVTINPNKKEEFEQCLNGISFALIGDVIANKEIIITSKEETICISLDELKSKYKETLGGY